MKGNEMYHIGLEEGQGAGYVIVPGDPERVKEIADCLEDSEFVASKREFVTYKGRIGETEVLVTSTGIGGPSAAIAIEELIKVGVHTFIRVGTCGGMQSQVNAEDLVIASGAVRMEGTTKEYAPIEYPAVANFEVLCALQKAADGIKAPFHVGVVHSKDSFYGQHAPETMPVGYELKEKWQAFCRLGVLASEMECAALFTVCAARQVRAGAVLTAVWNQEQEDDVVNSGLKACNDKAIRCAVEAIRLLAGEK